MKNRAHINALIGLRAARNKLRSTRSNGTQKLAVLETCMQLVLEMREQDRAKALRSDDIYWFINQVNKAVQVATFLVDADFGEAALKGFHIRFELYLQRICALKGDWPVGIVEDAWSEAFSTNSSIDDLLLSVRAVELNMLQAEREPGVKKA